MQIRFDGPPGHVSGRFVEVEDERGRSIRVGRWAREGTDWLLIIPEDQGLREAVKQVLVELDGFLSIEQQGLDWEGVILPRLADRLRFALANPNAIVRLREGLTCETCGGPLGCVCHPAHLKAVIFDESKEKRMSGTIGEKLDQIISICQMGTGRGGIRELENSIVKLAHDIDNQLEDRLCPSQDPNGECNAVNEAIGRAEDLERRLEGELSARLRAQDALGQALRVQDAIRRERGYAEDSCRRYKGRLGHVTAQLSALHDEFRTAAQRLKFTANWLENTHAPGTSAASYARDYAAAAKEVLDKGLDWLVDRNRGRGVMDSTAASKSAGAGSSPAARANRGAAEVMASKIIQNDTDLCMLCSSGGECVYASWSKTALWLDIGRKLVNLARSSNAVWAANEQRAVLNLMWHYRKVD